MILLIALSDSHQDDIWSLSAVICCFSVIYMLFCYCNVLPICNVQFLSTKADKWEKIIRRKKEIFLCSSDTALVSTSR